MAFPQRKHMVSRRLRRLRVHSLHARRCIVKLDSEEPRKTSKKVARSVGAADLSREAVAAPLLTRAREGVRSGKRAKHCTEAPGHDDSAEHWDTPAYGEGAKYWDSKHIEDKNPYEWMQSYEDLSKLIAKFTDGRKEHRLLHVGCGSSLLTEDMYDDGYQEIVNIDISSVVVQKMRDRNKDMRPKMKWLVMDATAMDFENGEFNIVIDKCTIDTLVCCNNSNAVVGKYLQQVVRVLKDDGVFLAFSFGKPAVRMSYLKESVLNLQVEVIKVPVPYTKSQFHYLYVCRKGAPLP